MKHSKKIAAGALTAMLVVSYATMPSKEHTEFARNPSAHVNNMQKFKKKKVKASIKNESSKEFYESSN